MGERAFGERICFFLSAHSGSASNSEKYSRCNGITQKNGPLAGPESQSAGLHRRPQDTSVACREVFQELTCFVRPPEKHSRHGHHVELIMLSHIT